MDEPLVPPSRQPKRFFDVAPPKNFTPSASSRPLIVSNRPEQADPMMTGALTGSEAIQTADAMPVTVNRPATEPSGSARTFPQSSEAMMQKEYDEIEHELPAGPSAPAATAATDAPVTVPDSAPMVEAAASLPDAATAGKVSQAVVAHHKLPHSLARDLLMMILLLVVIVAAVDVLLDSGVWKPTSQFPHTHFFNKN